jgi:BirA family biotin operon repressor/biotin-[acetyl-CoA-carboxylase] ligase
MLLTIAAAVAVSRVAERVGEEDVGIKWVNDIFCGGKKICGILSEAVCDMESGRIESIVVGIGVNINAAEEDFPEELRPIAGSISAKGISRAQIAAEISSELLSICENLTSPQLIEEYKSRLFILGESIEYVKDGVKKVGIAKDVTASGALVVEGADGCDILSSGEISLGSAHFVRRQG